MYHPGTTEGTLRVGPVDTLYIHIFVFHDPFPTPPLSHVIVRLDGMS